MDKFNIIVVFSIVAAAFFGRATIIPALAQVNISMTMDISSISMNQMGSMTMMWIILLTWVVAQ
jgi:hypothetical protein